MNRKEEEKINKGMIVYHAMLTLHLLTKKMASMLHNFYAFILVISRSDVDNRKTFAEIRRERESARAHVCVFFTLYVWWFVSTFGQQDRAALGQS